jgi:signal transduction histidine kinase
LGEAVRWLDRAQAPLDPRQLEPVNLADVVRDHVGALTPRYPGRSVTLDAPDELLVAAEERLLGRAVSNLVDNALKYSPEGERVEVRLEGRAGEALVQVADHGTGIPEPLRERVFEPFFRGGHERASTHGFGLGLPLARAAARALGGDVVLSTSSTSGTRFELRLPLIPAGA